MSTGAASRARSRTAGRHPRAATRAVLLCAGVPRVRVLCVPADCARPLRPGAADAPRRASRRRPAPREPECAALRWSCAIVPAAVAGLSCCSTGRRALASARPSRVFDASRSGGTGRRPQRVPRASVPFAVDARPARAGSVLRLCVGLGCCVHSAQPLLNPQPRCALECRRALASAGLDRICPFRLTNCAHHASGQTNHELSKTAEPRCRARKTLRGARHEHQRGQGSARSAQD